MGKTMDRHAEPLSAYKQPTRNPTSQNKHLLRFLPSSHERYAFRSQLFQVHGASHDRRAFYSYAPFGSFVVGVFGFVFGFVLVSSSVVFLRLRSLLVLLGSFLGLSGLPARPFRPLGPPFEVTVSRWCPSWGPLGGPLGDPKLNKKQNLNGFCFLFHAPGSAKGPLEKRNNKHCRL